MQQLSPAVEKPAHVPAERVVDFDVFSFPIENAEYQLALKRLNAAGVPEIFWTPRNGGHRVVTRATDIDLLLKDPARFSSRTISVPKVEGGMPPMKPIQLDPPEHVKYRVLLASALSPKAVDTLAEDARKLSIELIDGSGACAVSEPGGGLAALSRYLHRSRPPHGWPHHLAGHGIGQRGIGKPAGT